MFNALAQTTINGKITGKVIDSATKAPVDFATISVFKADSKNPVNGISTDSKGNFSLSGIPAGEYRVTVDFIGYREKVFNKVTISSSTTTVPLGTILLTSATTQLNAVNVTAKVPIVENKIDKVVYNAANDLTAQGGVALDVLKKVPMVSVDIDGNVELQGSSGIRFLINGKPSTIFGASLADALQSIPASQISTIEVITSPGAKYDAQGTGGIINIVLKDNKFQGVNGSVNLSAGIRLENGSINLNARRGNFGVGVFFSGNTQLNTTAKNTTNRTAYNNARDTATNLFQSGSNPFTRNSYKTGINLNWSVTPKDELTATFGYNDFRNHGTGFTSQNQSVMAGGDVSSAISSTRTSASRFGEKAVDFSLGYKKTFKREGQQLDFLYLSSFGTNIADASQQTDYLTGAYPSAGLRSNNPGKDRQTEITLDYAQPLSKSFTLETGAKTFMGNLTSNVFTDTLQNGAYVVNPSQTYSFNYKRNIYAGYASLSFALFKDFFTGKAGLRYERTHTTGTFSGAGIPDYNTFAPAFTLQHKLDDSQSVKFSYSYRIERPDYGDLNPFYNISDPHNISTGNPLLKPEISKNFELGYSKNFNNGGNIYLAAFYRNSPDNIQALSTYYDVLNVNGTDYTAVSLTQRFNLGSQKNIGASIFGSVPVTGKLNLRTNIQLGQRQSSNVGLATVNAFAYRVNLNATYQFPHDLVAEVFGNYNSQQKNIQSIRPAFFNYNLAIRKQFLNKNASIGLTTANPFAYYITQRQTLFGSNFNQTNVRLIPSQSFGVTLTYKFGKLKFDKEKDTTPQLPDMGQ
ncbi:outer membrane beta-barrel family protein [Mucilaginibacter gynuensis]|uniref:Outer membrane beta-barrel family protein n=2 Tax=Mucilaginibacter gynuensis TaxID=1302236 RepID=A0ABP8FQ66_9SPHI